VFYIFCGNDDFHIYSAWGMFQDWVHKSGEVEIKRPMTQRVGGFP